MNAAHEAAFHSALQGGVVDDPLVAALAAQPAFAVYRNTVRRGCIDALQGNYPAVSRLVGPDWFRSAASVFTHTHPPTDARLMAYGDGFADFLAGFEPASELPYLPGVARIERAWTESHLAADAPVLPAQALALPPEQLGSLVLRPHLATRWVADPAHPVRSIWQRNRAEAPVGAGGETEIAWQAEAVLLTRPHGAVEAYPIGHGHAAFLSACARGETLLDAAAACAAADTATPIAEALALLLAAGAFQVDPP